MGQLRGLMYLGFVIAVVSGWVITHYRERQSKIKYQAGSDIATPTPEEGLYHSNWNIRLQTLETLLEDKSRNLLEILVYLLGDPISDIRLIAMSELTTYGNDALGELALTLSSDNLTARESAAQTLVAIGTPEIVPTLIHSLVFDESAWVRAPAAQGLGIVGGDEATTALIRALNDSHPDVNQAVRAALEKIGTPVALNALKES